MSIIESNKQQTNNSQRNAYQLTMWTNSYFVSTVGGAPLEVIKQYIENQKTSQRQKDKLG